MTTQVRVVKLKGYKKGENALTAYELTTIDV